jgi:predicted DsbA family dithiol-disulfide isomerase
MAERAGLDMGKVDECLASGRADRQVEDDMAKANAIGVRGTPAFYINGRSFEGGPEELVAAIEEELAGS